MMKIRLFFIGKWLALAVFLLVAGCFYGCGSSKEPGIILARQENADGIPLSDVEAGGEKELDVQESSGEVQTAAEGKNDRMESAVSPKVCFVHVCGQVQNPGVYELEEGQRVFEAIALAGGFTECASNSWLNLATPVFDGMKLEVPDENTALKWQETSGATGNSAGQPEATSKVNINTASEDELKTLKGIGQSRAEDIVHYRQQCGGFSRIEDIMEVPGIKEAAFRKIKDDITVQGD